MRLLLGVSGGIAAYKAADLVSKAVGQGWEVRVVMTANATRFVAPLTFEALTGHRVMLDAFSPADASDRAIALSSIEHIAWAKWAEVALVAPLTANTLAKLAVGLADDALTTLWMALPPSVPRLLAPAMNTAMWQNPVTQRNIAWIDALGGYAWVPPVSKRLACGDVGDGALAEVHDLLEAVRAARS